MADAVFAALRQDGMITVAAVNKDGASERKISLEIPGAARYRVHTLNGESTDSYNDVGVDGITRKTGAWIGSGDMAEIALEPHSVNVIEIERE